MKFFRLDLLTLLISLFILNGCKNQDSAGLGVNSTNQLGSNLIDTSTIVINTVPEDSVITSGLAKNALANFNDPTFGTSISSIATDLNLPFGSAYVPPTGTIMIDSTRLVLRYTSGFYGDSITSSYTINVYQLNRIFNKDSIYYSLPYNSPKPGPYSAGALLGSLTFNARPHDSIKIYNIIKGSPDTLIKVPPQIRIPISNSFINTNFFAAPSTTLGSNAIFANSVKGLYIAIDRTKSTGAGGALLFSSADSVAIYYRSVSGTSIDTEKVVLPVLHTALQIQHVYSTTIQNELANKNTGSRNTFYLQGLAGLRAKINFPNLLVNLRKSLLNRPGIKDSVVLINRAELVITPAPGSFIPYSPIPKISMYQLDLALQRTELQDAANDVRAGGINIFGGFYNSTLNSYHFIITAYLQDLLAGKTVNYGTYIGPIDIYSADAATVVDIFPTPQVVSRLVAVGTDKTSPFRIKLNIIYTKVAKF